MKNNCLINRRTYLRGLGAMLALPLLDTMGWADSPKGKAASIRSWTAQKEQVPCASKRMPGAVVSMMQRRHCWYAGCSVTVVRGAVVSTGEGKGNGRLKSDAAKYQARCKKIRS